MNDSNIVSATVAADLSGKEFYGVKLTSTGINLAASTDRQIGVLRRGNDTPQVGQSAVGMACAVALIGGAHLDFAQIGSTTSSITKGDELQPDASNPGKLVPKTNGTVIALAWESVASPSGGAIRVLFL